MRHEWFVFREHGFRYWIAYVLVRAAYRVKDTTFYQVIRIPGGSAAMIAADTWGTGVFHTLKVDWDASGEQTVGRPCLREFDDFDQALDWMRGDSE